MCPYWLPKSEPADCRMASWFADAPNVSFRRTPLPSEGRVARFAAGFCYWRSALAREQLDIFENFNMPLVTSQSARNVMTIHDVRGLRSGGNPFARMLFTRVLKAACTGAEQVIPVSEAVKQEILDACPNANVAVVHDGVDLAGFVPLPPDWVGLIAHHALAGERIGEKPL